MFGLSFTHIMVLLVLALIFIGPEQLPEVARTIGRFLNEFKRTTSVLAEDMKQSVRDERIGGAGRSDNSKSSKEIDDHNQRVSENHPKEAVTVASTETDPAKTSIKDSDESKKG